MVAISDALPLDSSRPPIVLGFDKIMISVLCCYREDCMDTSHSQRGGGAENALLFTDNINQSLSILQ